jgi:hypothetical protein
MSRSNGRVEISGRIYVTPRFFADKLGVSLTNQHWPLPKAGVVTAFGQARALANV